MAGRRFKEQKKKGDFDRKNREFVVGVCRYWSLKRESRRGALLLKRLHLEVWSFCASFCVFQGWLGCVLIRWMFFLLFSLGRRLRRH